MNTQTSNFSLFARFFYVTSMLLTIGCMPLIAGAEGTVIRSGERVGVEANQLLEGDFYGLGQTITISGEATRDVYALGGTVTTNAPVQEDLVVVGGVIQVHGEVKDDARLIGGEIVIAKPIEDDLVVVGGTVHILSTAEIKGDLIFFGGEITIDGPVKGTLYGTANVVRINAAVGGDVNVRVGETLTLGDAANITGNVSYKSDSDLVRAQGAVVSGVISRDAFTVNKDSDTMEPLILNVLVLIFSSLTLFFLAKSRVTTLLDTITEGYGRLGLIGLGIIIAVPIVSIILMASIIGFIVGLALFLCYIVLVLLALMFIPIAIGALAQRIARLGHGVSIFTVVLGVLITLLIPFIPYVGGLFFFLVFVVIVGGLCSEIYRFYKNS